MTDREKVVRLPSAAEIEEEAAAWYARFDSEGATIDDRLAFEAWRAQSPKHAEAFARMQDTWEAFDSVLTDVGLPSDERRGNRQVRVSLADRLRGRNWTLPASVAAAFLLAVAGLGITMGVGSGPSPIVASHAPATYVTHVGDRQTIMLEDGSQITLNTDSQARVLMGERERVVWLTRGEAYFAVAKDARRPFQVRTAEGVVQAVGTAFSVRLREGSVDLTVTEGKVAVLDRRAASAAVEPKRGDKRVALVSAGEKAVIAKATADIKALPPAAVDDALAWRSGYSVFAGESLPQALAEVGRYTDVRIDIADPDLNALRITGRFKNGNVDSMLDALEAGFDVRVERVDGSHIRLSQG
jgi:transmembrane sensor